MGKKGDLSDFERGVVVGARRAGLSISETGLQRMVRKKKICSERQLCGQKSLVDVRGQRRMGKLVRDDRKATVTQITTCYHQGMQNTTSECTTRRTLKKMGYSSKNRKLRLQFARAHRNCTIEDWKNIAWPRFQSRFQLRHSDGRVRIWRKQHESVDPSYVVSTVQAGGGGVMVWEIFSWHTLGPLVPIEHCLNAAAYLSIVADHVHPFMTTVYPSSDGYFQQGNVTPCHKAHIISNLFLEHDNEFTVLQWPPQSPDHNPIEHLWDVVEREMCSDKSLGGQGDTVVFQDRFHLEQASPGSTIEASSEADTQESPECLLKTSSSRIWITGTMSCGLMRPR
uniref:Tc1-like transposase DDE domain-containing protein n=1 Tax=Pygocentrus nattereri TaxID=42514 RepID=A0AAR2INL3_PYGNA